jgi:hypothetical protein
MWWVLLLLLLVPGRADAHPLAPIALSVEQQGDDVSVTVKRARVQPRGASFLPRFPSSCTSVAPVTVVEQPSFLVEQHRLRCDGSLVGATLGMDGLSEADVDAVVRVALDEDRVLQGLLDQSSDVYVVPARVPVSEVAAKLVRSGLGHLLGGFDHLLFVLGLVLLLRRPRRVLLALTAFTAGHAISMCAASLGWIALPGRIAEAAIAATLMWLALEVVQRDRAEHEMSRPYLASLAVGLVHGLGFAAAFSEAGVTGSDLGLALGAFHIGIELGQVVVVLVALLAMRLVAARRETLARAAGYAIGGVACMWLIERAVLVVS